MTDLKKPIMIVCTGRSGSTMYSRIIARHRDVGFLSTLNQAFPSQVWLSVFSNLYSMKVFNSIRDTRYFPKPFSPYKFWEQYLPGITRHDRPLYPEDVPEESIEPLRKTVSRILRFQGKTRLLYKVTGWARMAYFNRIFPDTLFIYLKRNPLDVVSSWLNAGWLNVTVGVDSVEWEWGEVPEHHYQVWKELGGGRLLSAAMKTQLDIDDIRNNIAQFPGRCHELDYEDLTANPMKRMRETLEFCELEWYDGFEAIVNSTRIQRLSNKWKKYLSKEDGDLLKEFFRRVNEGHSLVLG